MDTLTTILLLGLSAQGIAFAALILVPPPTHGRTGGLTTPTKQPHTKTGTQPPTF